jgi:pimeloyl-ACP methyl ester carboxylesterase
VPAASVRELARLIPGARYVELPGADIYPFLGDTDAVVDEIEGFLDRFIHLPISCDER